MLKNHIIFAFRLFKKERIYSTLNLLGLTLGISVGIVLFLYLQHELGYDKHFKKYDQIYRFSNHLTAQGADFNTARSSRRLGEIFKEELPEVIEYVRFLKAGNPLTTSETSEGRRQFYEDAVYLTDSTIFKVFDHKFYEGNPETCLAEPGKIVLTKSIKEKYFGQEPALGKIINFNNDDDREVTAVISDLPENTHLKYEILISGFPRITWDNDGGAERTSEVFWNPSAYNYLLMPKNYDVDQFYEKFPAIHDKTFKIFGDRIQGNVKPDLQRLDEIHFGSDKIADRPTGNIDYVYTFLAVGIFIILLACINYMNLATARSATRTGEMGVRKVLGNSRGKLFTNVMIEALLMSFIAMILANVMTLILLELTPFNAIIGRDLSLNYFSNPELLIASFSITFLIGFLSGIYPAIYIPSVPVVVALKGTFTGDKASSTIRKILITLQFVISLFVIICTLLMDRQVKFMQNRDLGFASEHTILIEVQDSVTESRIDVIKNELMKNPNVIGTTTSFGIPGENINGPVMWIEKDSGMVQQFVYTLYAGKNYLDLMNLEVIEGRGFREDSESDFQRSYLVNEAAVKAFGWEGNALGKKVKYFHGEEEFKVVGVFKDFNFESLHNPINPLFVVLYESDGGTFYVKVRGEKIEETLAYVEEVWTRFDTQHPFDYRFLNDVYREQYEAEQTQQKLISILSYISIIISLLGLIGLSAFTASQKAKEISIRKVLGARISTIVVLFSKGYLLLILIAFVIAVPLADYAIVEWMSDFAYRMPISWWYYIVPGLLVLLLGLVTVSIQSLRSAKADPVEGLRKE